jgi:MipA family protein
MKKRVVSSVSWNSATLAAVVCGGFWHSMAAAQDGGPPPDAPMTQDLEIMLGAGISSGPAYLGSDDRKTRGLPLISARWRSGWFAGVGGVGFRFASDGPLSYGLRLSLDPGRKESDSEDLRGMGDIDARPELGGFASYRLMPGLSLNSSIRYGSGDNRDGLLGDIGLRGTVPLGGSHRLFGGISTTFANRAAMQSQFGINASQAATSGYTLYEPKSGARDLSLSVGYGLSVTPSTMLSVGLTARSLLGDAKDSPLTRAATGTSANIMLSFRL